MERIKTAFIGVLAVFLAVGIISFNIVYAHKPLKTRESNKQINFRPSLALIGYNLSVNIKNIYSENSIQKYYASGNNALPFSFPQSVEAIFANYTGIISSTEFYEPFTQTSYGDRQEVFHQWLASSGTYFVVIFDRNIISQDDKKNSVSTGKYSLAIGEIGNFSLYDFFSTLHEAWFDTKFFFEDYSRPALVIAGVIAAPLIVACYLIKGHGRQSKS